MHCFPRSRMRSCLAINAWRSWCTLWSGWRLFSSNLTVWAHVKADSFVPQHQLGTSHLRRIIRRSGERRIPVGRGDNALRRASVAPPRLEAAGSPRSLARDDVLDLVTVGTWTLMLV
ncbi:hypothetical protein CALCODRAFT_372225 [Calocera cornea HHB12733]|uniref:Uncharacterized protein n=1 Tax=Calocera cornea HHB12733 TaxID=1353952 RepID=A0A165EGN1_9BASI|nr:hypothetical protein CALCODRAFT_372225 [Calocera cornea HHB12733]